MEFSSKEECEKFILKSVKELGECALAYYDLYSEVNTKPIEGLDQWDPIYIEWENKVVALEDRRDALIESLKKASIQYASNGNLASKED